MLSDSHCHLDIYPPEELTRVLARASANNVDVIVSMGMDLESSAENIRLARSHEVVLAAVGIHPWNAVPPSPEVRRQLYGLARKEQVAAIGEIGLDYVRNPETKEIQKDLLRYELSLARETGLPVSLHCRQAHRDMMEILRKETSSGIKGSVHGFSGNLEELKDWLDLGFCISIGFRGFLVNEVAGLAEVVTEIPLERLLTETDAAGSGQPAGPADVLLVAQRLASLRKVSTDEIADAATANLKRLHKKH